MLDRSRRPGELGGARTATTVLRCAVYTRKSTEEGLEQEFNSLQAQREACEAYIASQRHEGWTLVKTSYDDGGYSGGSMDRPGLTRLLADVQSRRVDIVVVYKVDRLTRALSDFARIVDIFDAQGASFVSVTQSFNTTTSMGRLTLNVLLSFAQFEREVTAERIRDKIAASKRKGMWMGGPLPFGYRVENRKLIIDAAEAITVRRIFDVYIETKSTIETVKQLKQQGIVTRRRERADGRSYGGIPFTRGPLRDLLRNRVYIGEIIHKGEHHPGEHEPILSQEIFDKAQALLSEQQVSHYRKARATRALLSGKIFDANGHRMIPSHTNKGGVRYGYYISNALLNGEKERAGQPSRISATEIETIVLRALRAQSQECELDDRGLVEHHLDHIQVFPNRVRIAFTPNASDQRQRDTSDDQHLESLDIPCVLGTRPTKRELVRAVGNPAAASTPPQAEGNRRRLLESIVRAQGWVDDLKRGKASSTKDIAEREGRSDRNVRMFLNLAFLAPDIIEAALDGTIASNLSATQIAQSLPLDWNDQRRMLLGAR